MKLTNIYMIGMVLASLGLAACSANEVAEAPKSAKETPMTFSVSHPSQTRVTATAFEEGDKIGLYVAETGLPLEIGGNLVNNEPLTMSAGKWTSQRTLYWDNGTYNAYAYFPYMEVESIEDQSFSVAIDQSTKAGYETSDLLFARTEKVTASTAPVPLTFRHIMSKLTVRLVKGEDFEGDMPDDAQVYVLNTVPSATVDLSAGVVTRNMRGSRQTIRARQQSAYTFGAIIVPQRLDNRLPFIEVVMKGVSYLFESRFQFKPGMDHLVNLVIDNNPDNVKIEIGGEVENWN